MLCDDCRFYLSRMHCVDSKAKDIVDRQLQLTLSKEAMTVLKRKSRPSSVSQAMVRAFTHSSSSIFFLALFGCWTRHVYVL